MKVTKQKGSKAVLEFKISKEDIAAAHKSAMQMFSQKYKFPGFRPGKVPAHVIEQKIGAQGIQQETNVRAVTKKYNELLQKEKLNILGEPSFDPKAMESLPGPIKIEVTLYPTVELAKDWEKSLPKLPKADVKKAEITERMVRYMEIFKLGEEVKGKLKKSDTAIISFAGFDDKKGQKAMDGTKAENQSHNVLAGQFLPDLEKAIGSMKVGDKKEKVPVQFPEDYHADDFKGKTVYFDVEVHSALRYDPKSMTDEQKTKIAMGKSFEDFEKELEKSIRQQKQRKEIDELLEKALVDMVKETKLDLPEMWTAREMHARMQGIKADPAFQKDAKAFWKAQGTTEAKSEAFLKEKIENGFGMFLLQQQILEDKGITLTKEEQTRISNYAKEQKNSNVSQMMFDSLWTKWKQEQFFGEENKKAEKKK